MTLYILLAWIGFLFPSVQTPEITISDEEKKLFIGINSYRKSLGLNEITLSPSLSKVAQFHAADLRDYPPKSGCNMHSWSTNGKWKSCCYTNDHKNPECMWNKPKELTNYKDKGYEISAMNTNPNVNWLTQWKGSEGHHEVIINKGIWKAAEWNAMGVAIRHPYAVVWFGMAEDSETED